MKQPGRGAVDDDQFIEGIDGQHRIGEAREHRFELLLLHCRTPHPHFERGASLFGGGG